MHSIRRTGIRNLLSGIVGQAITLGLGILIPRFMIVSYGSEVNGLLCSVVQIFAYFSLFEAGIGAVALQALYRAQSKVSVQELNSILAAVNTNYKKIGYLYAISSLSLAIIYPMLVKSTIPFNTVFFIIILNAVGPVTSFLFQKKYLLLLQSEGKLYLINSLSYFVLTASNIAKITFIYFGFDVLTVQAIVAIITVSQMGYVAWYIKRYYKWINLNVKPDISSIKQSKNALVHQISALVFNNLDIVALSLFSTLKSVSVYAIYALMCGIVKTLISTINSSIEYILGQKFHSSKDDFIYLNRIYERTFLSISFVLFTTAYFYIDPFVRLYTTGIGDVNYLMPFLPELFIVICLLSYIRVPSMQVIQFASHFRETQYRSVIEATLKLIFCIALVKSYGIYGVLIANIISLLYRSNDIIIYACRKILMTPVLDIYKSVFINAFTFVLLLIIHKSLQLSYSDYCSLILSTLPCIFIVSLTYIIINSLFDKIYRMFVISLYRKGTCFIFTCYKSCLQKNKS